MPTYERHVFVCTNQRPAGHPRGCCAEKGAETLREIFKRELARRGLRDRMRANAAGCLDACEFGPSVVIYPEGIWYTLQSEADVHEVIERHLINGEIVTRLLMPGQTVAPPAPASTH